MTAALVATATLVFLSSLDLASLRVFFGSHLSFQIVSFLQFTFGPITDAKCCLLWTRRSYLFPFILLVSQQRIDNVQEYT